MRLSLLVYYLSLLVYYYRYRDGYGNTVTAELVILLRRSTFVLDNKSY